MPVDKLSIQIQDYLPKNTALSINTCVFIDIFLSIIQISTESAAEYTQQYNKTDVRVGFELTGAVGWIIDVKGVYLERKIK